MQKTNFKWIFGIFSNKKVSYPISNFKTHVQQTMKSRSLSLIKYFKQLLIKRCSSEPNIVLLSQNVHEKFKIHVFLWQLCVLWPEGHIHILSVCKGCFFLQINYHNLDFGLKFNVIQTYWSSAELSFQVIEKSLVKYWVNEPIDDLLINVKVTICIFFYWFTNINMHFRYISAEWLCELYDWTLSSLAMTLILKII